MILSMDVYDISNISDTKEDVVTKWTLRQRIKASKYKTLHKILECEVSVLSAKLPFLEENQIKCIALNWLGIPTIMGRIPNSQTIEYLIPAGNKKKVMTMIQLLFSKRKASRSKREENLFNELSEMILKSTGLVSLKNYTSYKQPPSYSRSTSLGVETTASEECDKTGSSMVLTVINDRHEEQINSLPEEHSSPETEGTSSKSSFQKPANKMDHKRKRRLFWGPGCELSEKRRKKGFSNTNRDSLGYSDVSEGSLHIQHDEMLDATSETVMSTDMITEDTSDSENIITSTPANPSCLNEKQSITKQKSTTKKRVFNKEEGTTEPEQQCTASDGEALDGTMKSLDSQLTENSALTLVQETNKERINDRNAGADSLTRVSKQNAEAAVDAVNTNEVPSENRQNLSGTNYTCSENHGNEIKETTVAATMEPGRTVNSSKNQIFQSEQISSSDPLMESEEVVPSQATSNDTFSQSLPHNVENFDMNTVLKKLKSSSAKGMKHLKISATELLGVKRNGSPVTTSERSEVSSEKGTKEQNTPAEIGESSHESRAALSPSLSSKVTSQELGHHSPIEYLSLEPYSSEQESQDKESPTKTTCWKDESAEEIPIPMTQNVDLLVDLFNPVTSATKQSTRTHEAGEPLDDATILSLDAL